MSKVLVNLYVPEIEVSYDLLIPVDLTVKSVINVVLEGLSVIQSGKYYRTGNEKIIVRSLNAVLHPDRLLKDYPIQDGDQLVLM